MAVKAKTTQEDLILYEILKNPVLCSEFINNIDNTPHDKEFKLHSYQREMVCDFNSNVSFCCARSVGKTWALTNMIIWAMVNNIYPGDYIVYTVPNKSHLEPVFDLLSIKLRTNSFLDQFIDSRKGINRSSWTVKLNNSTQLICRIAGNSGDERNVAGLHTPFVMADELGFYPWGTWLGLQPIMNTFTDGFRLIGSGVPTGMRENNVLYHIDKENSNYTKHRISAYDNPRFTEEDEERAIEQYGGKDSDDFIHFVLGQHGSPVFAVFDRRLMQISNYPVYRLTLDGTKMRESLEEYVTKLKVFPPAPENNKGIILGVDLGYTEPTAIVVLYFDRQNLIKFHGRIQMNKVPYPIQTRLIDIIDDKFNPIIIGIDEGHAGKGVVQELTMGDSFIHKDYKNKLYPVRFGAWMSLGFDQDGEEIKSKVKPLSVSILQEYSEKHKIVYSSTDQEMITELERMTYYKNTAGDVVYRTLTPKGGQRGEDHFTSALLCATIAYYREHDMLVTNQRRGKLYQPRWFKE